ncbi:MAG: NUDIX hydrolase [Lachnospiraceae bacterium]|nr:NUDIX hydrolase [Lachnospiraceae bacterium]
MKLIKMEKVRDTKYLKNYELTYENKSGKQKIYEIVSHRELSDPSQLGQKCSGLSIVARCHGRLLLLREFRMGVNRYVYNLCAGMIEEGESIEDCIRRELYEETGLSLKKIEKILPPAYAAVSITDIVNQIAFVEAEGEITDAHTSDNEEIRAAFYTPQEVERLLETEMFTSRCQVVAYQFARSESDFI